MTRIFEVDRDYALAAWHDLFIVIWRKNTTLQGARQLHRRCREFGKNRPHGIFLLTIVPAGSPAPDPAVRERIAKFLADGGDYIKASAVVVEGTGFRAAMVRSVVTGLTLLARQPFPHQVCSLGGAAALFGKTARNTAISFEEQRMIAGLNTLRAAIDGDTNAQQSLAVP